LSAPKQLYPGYLDVVVITENGYENFMDGLPTEPDEIEKLAGQGERLRNFHMVSENKWKQRRGSGTRARDCRA
jgi:hypothetical protein